MPSIRLFLPALVLLGTSLGCSSSETHVDIGDVTVGSYTFHIFREGDPVAAGVDTRLVLKPTAGGNPTSITGWIGVESGDGSEKAAADYDSGDGDYDDNLHCPSPLPDGSKFWFQVVDGNGQTLTGSIDYK